MVFSRKGWISISVISALFLAVAGIFFLAFPFIYRREVNARTNLVEKSFLFPIWRDLPLPIYKRVFFFNITNVEDFLYQGATMRVDEVGPYVYIGTWTKEDITWSNDGTVSYREVKKFRFSPEDSIGSEDDKIFTLNAPYVAAADVLRGFGTTVRKTANSILSSYNLIIYKPIKELAFGGYRDPLMDVSKLYQWNSPFTSGSFAWLYGHNSTDEGDFDVFTGETDHKLLNMIDKWNGFKDLNFWKGKYCNMINGTNAEFHPPIDENQVEYTFFQPLVCRSVTFRYSGYVDHKGIDTKRFENEEDIFSKDNPDNDCFQLDPELKSGVLDVSNCWYGAPVVLSFPHFYLADSSFLENIEGLNPSKQRHGSHIDAEPISGATVDLSVKFQMNMKVKPVSELRAFQNISAGVYPVFWLDLKVVLPDALMDTLIYQLFRPRTVVYGALTIVVVLSVIGFFCAVFRMDKETSEEKVPLLERNSSSSFSSEHSDRLYFNERSYCHENVDTYKSTGSYRTISNSDNLYQSFVVGDSEEASMRPGTPELQRKESEERMSFVNTRVLTVI